MQITEIKVGVLVILVFEKAFYSVEWDFSFNVFNKIAGEKFLKWVKFLYKNTKFKMKNNGWAGWYSNGIRHECPRSALLYLFVTMAKISALKFLIIQIFKEYVSFPKKRDFSLQRAGYNFYTVIPTQKSIGSSKSMKFAFKKNILFQIIQWPFVFNVRSVSIS